MYAFPSHFTLHDTLLPNMRLIPMRELCRAPALGVPTLSRPVLYPIQPTLTTPLSNLVASRTSPPTKSPSSPSPPTMFPSAAAQTVSLQPVYSLPTLARRANASASSLSPPAVLSPHSSSSASLLLTRSQVRSSRLRLLRLRWQARKDGKRC